jgi:hypothetical protein
VQLESICLRLSGAYILKRLRNVYDKFHQIHEYVAT